MGQRSVREKQKQPKIVMVAKSHLAPQRFPLDSFQREIERAKNRSFSFSRKRTSPSPPRLQYGAVPFGCWLGREMTVLPLLKQLCRNHVGSGLVYI